MVNGLPDAARVVFDDERVVANAGCCFLRCSRGGWESRP